MHLQRHDFSDPDDVLSQWSTLDRDGHGTEAMRSFGILAGLLRELLLTDRGRLGLSNSRNHARLVETHDGTTMVLKLTMVPVGDETGALLLWDSYGIAGVLTAQLRAHGASEEGFSWSLQQHLPGRGRSVADGSGILPAALELAGRLHFTNVTLPDVLETLDRRLALSEVSEHDGISRTAWELRRLLCRLSPGPSVLLHGDFGANNVLDDGSLRVIDPAGFSGPACYDAARFVARSTSRLPVAGRLDAIALEYCFPLEEFALLSACELLDVAATWALEHDITGRGTDALLEDAAASARLSY